MFRVKYFISSEMCFCLIPPLVFTIRPRPPLPNISFEFFPWILYKKNDEDIIFFYELFWYGVFLLQLRMFDEYFFCSLCGFPSTR